MVASVRRAVLAPPVLAAALLSLGLVVTALLAARALGERDEAVRAGIVSSLAHELERGLREVGPDELAATLEDFCRRHADALAGVEVSGAGGALARCGEVGGTPNEVALALGRDWRGLAGRPGFGPGPGRGQGGLRAVLYPRSGLGKAGPLAGVVVAGAALTAVALLGLAVVAQRGTIERQRREAAEAEQRRLAAVALAGAGLAHRVRNPLAAVKGTAQLLARQVREEQRSRVQRIVEASDRIEGLLSRLLEFARPPEAHAESIDLDEILPRLVEHDRDAVAVKVAAGARARADREHLTSMVEELIANARAAGQGSAIELEAWRDGSTTTIEVRDRGPGPGDDPGRLFEPYVTTRAEGTGLGLAIVAALAHANRGAVTLAARSGGGCVARLVLPAAEA